MPGASGSGGSETQNFCYDEQNRLVWAGNSGAQPGAGNGTCGSGTLASGLNGASYSNASVYTHLGQLWQGPLAGGSAQYQYLYCDSSHPHELTGLYATSATCSSKTGQGYASSYDAFGNVTGRTFSGTTATLSYDNLNHFTEWNAGSTNQEWYLYDALGNRVLRRFTNSNGTTIIVYAFGLEEHNYSGAGAHQNDTYYYSLGGRLLGALDGNGTTFYLTDTLGSILASFNNAAGGASVKGNQVFAPYGTGRYYKGNINTLKGFTGQYNDGSGLDYFNARYYDPVASVFLSADTANGNLAGMNPYAYVNGNPETKRDPTGRYIAGPSGQTYYSGSPYYTQGGEAYSVQTGQAYNGDGFVNGWYPGHGPNAATSQALVPYTPIAVKHTVVTTRPRNRFQISGVSTCAPVGPSQGLCTDLRVLYALYLLNGGVVGLPGQFSLCDECGPGGGPNENRESGSGKSVLASDTGGENLGDAGASGDVEEGRADLGCGPLSFAPATLVATAKGEQAIGTLRVGEKVWAYNPKTHKMEQEPILHVWINHDNDLVDLTLTTTTPAGHGKAATRTSETIHTNKKHPFLTKEKGFLPVGQITLGMHVLRADGTYGVVTGWKVVPGAEVMYNLEVAQDHTFTVGTGQWVVHNSDCGGQDPAPVGTLKKLNESFLRQNGIDAHAVKDEVLGGGSGAPYNIYMDRVGNLFLLRTGASKDTAIYTYYNISDFTGPDQPRGPR